jgi:hypothetical protein
MRDYTDDERAHYSAEAHRKCGNGELFEAVFVPDGAEDDEGLSVLWRRFTPAEFAAWFDRPSSLTDAVNTAMDVILAIDGADGKSIPAATSKLADLMDGALGTILARAARPLGFVSPDEIVSLPLGRKATAADVARFGLPDSTLTLREVYTDPGALRLVKAAELPAIVVRRPSREEWSKRISSKASAGSRDLLVACIVEPGPIEARRVIVETYSALGASLTTVFAEMRGKGATLEGKGGRQGSPLQRT